MDFYLVISEQVEKNMESLAPGLKSALKREGEHAESVITRIQHGKEVPSEVLDFLRKKFQTPPRTLLDSETGQARQTRKKASEDLVELLITRNCLGPFPLLTVDENGIDHKLFLVAFSDSADLDQVIMIRASFYPNGVNGMESTKIRKANYFWPSEMVSKKVKNAHKDANLHFLYTNMGIKCPMFDHPRTTVYDFLKGISKESSISPPPKTTAESPTPVTPTTKPVESQEEGTSTHKPADHQKEVPSTPEKVQSQKEAPTTPIKGKRFSKKRPVPDTESPSEGGRGIFTFLDESGQEVKQKDSKKHKSIETPSKPAAERKASKKKTEDEDDEASILPFAGLIQDYMNYFGLGMEDFDKTNFKEFNERMFYGFIGLICTYAGLFFQDETKKSPLKIMMASQGWHKIDGVIHNKNKREADINNPDMEFFCLVHKSALHAKIRIPACHPNLGAFFASLYLSVHDM